MSCPAGPGASGAWGCRTPALGDREERPGRFGGGQSTAGHKKRPEVPGQKSAHRVRSARGKVKHRTERGARVWELWVKECGEVEGRREGGVWGRLAGRTDGRTDEQRLVQRPRRGKRKWLPGRPEGPGWQPRRAAMFASAAERENECKKRKGKKKKVFKNSNESGTAGQPGPAAPEPGSSLAHA